MKKFVAALTGSVLIFSLPAITRAGSATALNAQGESRPSNQVTVTASGPATVYIAIRTDGHNGSGTQADPYDGSTAAKFDAVMSNLQTSNQSIHLVGGPPSSPFQTYATHNWIVRPGWQLSGDGINNTTLQVIGPVTGMTGTTVLQTDPRISSDGITISNMTIDCNWPELSTTAPMGVNGEQNFVAQAINLYGSNNLIDHVASINSYGSRANSREHFAITINSPTTGDGTNDVIQFSSASQPYGNYGSPFALFAYITSTTSYAITNSKVVSCTANGLNNRVATSGFTISGVNLANVRNVTVDSNTFYDCKGIAYSDAGYVDGLTVTNNICYRGWGGVGLMNSALPKQNVTIANNTIGIQNRNTGANYGISTGVADTTNLTINNNTVTLDSSGSGWTQWWGILVDTDNTLLIHDNTIGSDHNQTVNRGTVKSGQATMYNNLASNGSVIPSLNGPAAPTLLTATRSAPNSTSKIDLAWQDNATNALGYQIYRSSPYSTGPFSVVATIQSATAETYQDTGLTPNTLYYYAVNAYDTITNGSNTTTVNGNFSNIANAQTSGHKHK
jgi:hypothetical protein